MKLAREIGENLLISIHWRIGNEKLFETIARVFYAEADIIGRNPSFDLTKFGYGLGLDRFQISKHRQNAISYIAKGRRSNLTKSGNVSPTGGKFSRWINVESNFVKIPS